MRSIVLTGLAGLVAVGAVAFQVPPAQAQSVGYVTGFPGRDPADDDEFGWGPAYRPETSFAQPGTPPTPGEFAAAEYYRRTGRTVYPPVGTFDPAAAPAYEVYERPRRVKRAAPRPENRRVMRQRAPQKRVVSR